MKLLINAEIFNVEKKLKELFSNYFIIPRY